LYTINEEEAPLKRLAMLDCFKTWRVYGEINEKIPSEIEKIEEMCQEKLEKLKILSSFFHDKT